MYIGNVQELFVKVTKRFDDYLRSYDHLKSTKSHIIIITQQHARKRKALFYSYIFLTENRMVRNPFTCD